MLAMPIYGGSYIKTKFASERNDLYKRLESSPLSSIHSMSIVEERPQRPATRNAAHKIENSLECRQVSLAPFLDIEGAFSNLKLNAIQEIYTPSPNILAGVLPERSPVAPTMAVSNGKSSKSTERPRNKGSRLCGRSISPSFRILSVNC